MTSRAAAGTRGRQEGKPSEVVVRRPDPAANGARPGWERRRERPFVTGDGPAVRGRLENHQELARRLGFPSPLAAQKLRHETRLSGRAPEKILYVHDPGLDLDEQKRSTTWVPADDVYRPAFSEVVERILGKQLPAGRGQLVDETLDQRRVIGVEEPGELAASPARLKRKRDLERNSDATDAAERDLRELPALDSRDDRLAYVRASGEIPLTEPASPPDRTDGGRKSKILHPRRMSAPVQPALIRGSRRRSCQRYRW
jgi:hypothetical protein